MDNTIPVIPPTSDTDEEAQLRAALVKQDSQSEYKQAPDRVPEPPKDAKEPESQPDKVENQDKSDSPEAEAEGAQLRDEKGRFKSKEAQGAQHKEGTLREQPEPTEPPPPPQSKDEARLARSWQRIEAEKTEVRNALAEVKQIKQQLEQQLSQARANPQGQPRFTSKQYSEYAKIFDQQGDLLMRNGDAEQAQQKFEQARQCRQAAEQYSQVEMTEAQTQQQAQFTSEWQRHAEAQIEKHPELGDPNTEEAQAMMELLEQEPIFGYIPDGFAKAVQFLQLRQDAAEASGLREKLVKLEAEVKELRGKTAIEGSGPAPKLGAVDFDNMSLEEMGNLLERQARQEDFSRTY